MLTLSVLDGSGRGFELDDGVELTVGAAPTSSVCLPAPDVSRSHALVTCSRGKVILLDLGSTNGTFVNGVRVKEAELAAGDQVRFSSVAAQVLSGSPASGDGAAAPAAPDHSTDGGVPALVEGSLGHLLARWGSSAEPALLALVDWLVGRRGLAGAAVLDAVGDDVAVLAAEGPFAGILDDPACAALVLDGTSSSAPAGIHLTLAGREALALKAAGTPWLLLLPERSMPDGGELALVLQLLAVGTRLDSSRSGGDAG